MRSLRTHAGAPLRRFTVEEYHRLGDAGILAQSERVELLDGIIVTQPRIRPPQASCVCRLTDALVRRLSKRATVRVRAPVVLDRFTEPEPDVSVLVRRADFYATAHPRSRDVLFAIEVLDGRDEYDRTLKLPLYAKTELADVWLIDPETKTIEVLRRPARRGYRERSVFGRGQVLTPLAFPRTRFRVNEILG